MAAIQVKECSYLGRGKPRRLLCAGKYLKNGKIVFIDRKNSVLLLTDPTTEHMTEKDLVPLLQNFDFKPEFIPKPSDVNEGFEDDQLLITFTGTGFSLGVVCKFIMQPEDFVLEPVLHFEAKQRTRSLVVLDMHHVCASTEWAMQVLNREGGVVAEFPRQKRDRGGLLMTDGNGRFYYGDGDRFCCCLWDGNEVAEEFRFTHQNMIFPRGSAISGEGNILVCCDTTKNIFQLSQAGEFLNILAGVQMRQNGDIDVHPDGKTFFTTFWEENEWPMLYRLAG